jgi:hypothetical protein
MAPLSVPQDLESIDMENFRHNYVNMTGFRLVPRENPRVKDIIRQMYKYQSETGAVLLNTSTIIKVRAAQYVNHHQGTCCSIRQP